MSRRRRIWGGALGAGVVVGALALASLVLDRPVDMALTLLLFVAWGAAGGALGVGLTRATGVLTAIGRGLAAAAPFAVAVTLVAAPPVLTLPFAIRYVIGYTTMMGPTLGLILYLARRAEMSGSEKRESS